MVKSAAIGINSPPRGSNPGGNCIFTYLGGKPKRYHTANAYLKYCLRSNLIDSPFRPSRQPFYEAVTLAIARKMGLWVPDFGVLLNKKTEKGAKTIFFARTPGIDPLERNSEGDDRLCYLISELVNFPYKPIEETTLAECETYSDETLKRLMAEEKIYRDLLMVGDISGRKDNFRLVQDQDNKGYCILYIDLGCSFVDAHGGVLDQRSEAKVLVHGDNASKKAIRAADQFLEKHYLLPNRITLESILPSEFVQEDVNGITDQDVREYKSLHIEEVKKKALNLKELAESPTNLELLIFENENGDLVPKQRKVSELISRDEINQMIILLKLNFEKIIHKRYKENPRVINLKSADSAWDKIIASVK